MKNLIIKSLLVSFIGAFALQGFSQRKPNRYELFHMEQISDTLYINQSEITVIEWLEFIYTKNYIKFKHIKHDNIGMHGFRYYDSTMMPDFDVIHPLPYSYLFEEFGKYDDYQYILALTKFTEIPIPNHDHKHDKNNEILNNHLNMPISGVSYEQAKEYCTWRTQIENFRFHDLMPEDSAEYFIKYRLPNPVEFRKIAGEQEVRYQRNNETCAYFNFKGAHHCDYGGHILDYPISNRIFPVMEFPPNEYGLYDMYGNLSEMTSVKGLSMGGSFKNSPEECFAEYGQRYNGPQTWLGFRCVAEQIKPLNQEVNAK